MQVVYNNDFNDLVRACILSEVKGYTPVRDVPIGVSYVKASDFPLNELFIEWDWVNGTPHNINALSEPVNLAVRNRFCSIELVFSVISQALRRGVDYVLTRRSIEAKRFCNLIIAVREELRSAKLGLKFYHYGNLLFGKYILKHNVSDLLSSFYEKRFPGKQVLINVELPVAIPAHSVVSPVSLPGAPQSPLTLNSFF